MKIKLALILMFLILIMGFSFGMAYQQDKQIEVYEQRIKKLSYRLANMEQEYRNIIGMFYGKAGILID